MKDAVLQCSVILLATFSFGRVVGIECFVCFSNCSYWDPNERSQDVVASCSSGYCMVIKQKGAIKLRSCGLLSYKNRLLPAPKCFQEGEREIVKGLRVPAALFCSCDKPLCNNKNSDSYNSLPVEAAKSRNCAKCPSGICCDWIRDGKHQELPKSTGGPAFNRFPEDDKDPSELARLLRGMPRLKQCEIFGCAANISWRQIT